MYAVSRTIVEKIIERLDLNVEITRNIDDADLVIAHKNFAKGGAKVLSTANDYRLQVFYVKTNSMAQIQKVIKDTYMCGIYIAIRSNMEDIPFSKVREVSGE